MTDEHPRSTVKILGDSQQLYKKKKADYGNSWRLVGKTLALWLQHQGQDELRVPATEQHINALGLFTRRLDKMVRAWNGWMVMEEGESFRVDESIAETQKDEVPYAAMHTQLAEEYAKADPEEILP